jgi:hypothetical protein
VVSQNRLRPNDLHARNGLPVRVCSAREGVTSATVKPGAQAAETGHIRSCGLLSPAAGMAPAVRWRARTTTDKAGNVPMQACRQPLTRDYDRGVLDRRIRSSAAAITRLDPSDPDVAKAKALTEATERSKQSRGPRLAARWWTTHFWVIVIS